MDPTRLFLRMSRLARNPPSAKRVALVLGVIGVCVILFGYERIFGWPDWLTVQKLPRGPQIR